MERGEATRGKVAERLTGSDSIEIKATIPHRQIDFAMQRFGLKADGSDAIPNTANGVRIQEWSFFVVGGIEDWKKAGRPLQPK